MLENACHKHSVFATLTYSEENFPKGGTLVPEHMKNFLKRLRKAYASVNRIRYYYVGEYGDITQRPHYHAFLFGCSPAENQIIANCWGYGGVAFGDCNHHTAQYIAGYVTKKMTKGDDPRLEGRYPEFARMSLKPGIGALSVSAIADALRTRSGSLMLANNGDVPNELRHEGKKYPLGRYLKNQLRGQLDVPKLGLESPALQQARESLRDLLVGYENAPSDVKKSVLINRTEGKVRRREARAKIFTSAKKGKWL